MKNIIKWLKVSTLLTGFCGLLSFGCLTIDHTQNRVYSVSAFSNITEVVPEGTNLSSGVKDYTIAGHFGYPMPILTNSSFVATFDYTIRIYYTGVGSYQSLDFTTILRNVQFKDGDGTVHVLSQLNRANNFYNIDLGSNDGTYIYKAFKISLGRLSYDTLNSLYNLDCYFELWTNEGFYNNAYYSHNFNLPFTSSSYNPLNSINYGTNNGIEANSYYSSLEALKNSLVDSYNDGYQVALDSNSETIYQTGFQDGYNGGYNDASIEGQNQYQNGYQAGYQNGENNAIDFYQQTQEGVYNNGYNAGYGYGFSDGQQSMQEDINESNISSYNEGYADGYVNGSTQDQTVSTIFSGILQVALVPINFFLAIFNFEILGINLSGFIRALFTIAITIIVIKTIFGGKGASE